MAFLQDHMAVRELDQRAQMLVDDEDRLVLALEPRQACPYLAADQRRQSFRCLVEDEQPGIGHQRPAYRQHLMLTAG